MRKAVPCTIYLVSVIFLLLSLACSDHSPPASDVSSTPTDSAAEDTAGTKTLEELLNADFESLTPQDADLLRLYTGGMDQAAYEEKHGPLDGSDGRGDERSAYPVLDYLTSEVWGAWEKVDIPGAVCGNNTPYKIFEMRSTGTINWLLGYTQNLIIYLEPGGACWDYPSCTGQSGIRGAANPDGIPDNFMNLGDYLDPDIEGGSPNAVISPLILKNHPAGDEVETARWNKVFIPYCTGDVYTGNRVATYEDSTGENQPLEYNHNGAVNIELVIEYLQQAYPLIDKLLVTGSSAGGVGALVNYHFFRKGLNPETSYLLNDSGPIFSAVDDADNQYRLHQKIEQEWNTGYLIDKLAADFPEVEVTNNFGQIHEALAQTYPSDPLGITLFTRDTNFSGYSYARFFDLDESYPDDVEELLRLWREDIDQLTATYDLYPNLSYYIPYFRNMNESHCTTIVEFTGTEYLDSGIDVGSYIEDLLNGNPMQSYREPDNPDDADVNSFWMELVNLLM
jgi:hypothetical protein